MRIIKFNLNEKCKKRKEASRKYSDAKCFYKFVKLNFLVPSKPCVFIKTGSDHEKLLFPSLPLTYMY